MASTTNSTSSSVSGSENPSGLSAVELGDELELEAEALATCATQCLEQVAMQAEKVQRMCGKMEEDAALMKAWNVLIKNGAQSLANEQEQAEADL